MLSPMKLGAIAFGVVAICSYGVWAGVIVRTGADGSVTVATERVRANTDEGGFIVTTDGGNTYSSQTFSSHQNSSTNSSSSSYSSSFSSSSSSTTQSSSTIPYSRLSNSDYLLLVSGSGYGSVEIEGQTVANLNDISTLRLNAYLRRGSNRITISGNGSTDLLLALVETERGGSPYFNSAGQVLGARQVMVQHKQSSSGGDWTSTLAISVQ